MPSRRVTLKLKPSVNPDNALPVDQSESAANHEPNARPATKRKPRPPRVRASKQRKSISTDSAPPPVVSPALRSRIRNESEISALDIGPSLVERAFQFNHPQNQVLPVSGHGRQSSEAHQHPNTGSQASSNPENRKTGQSLRTGDLQYTALASHSVPLTTACPRPPSHPSKIRFSAPLENGPALRSIEQPTYGDIHDAGYGFGFGEEAAGLLSSDMLPPGAESEWSITPSTPESVRYQHRSPSDLAEQELLEAQNQELQRYEQSLVLFPGISIEKCTLDEDEF